MRVALISDVHANLPALDAVLEDIDAAGGVDAVYHLGDLVGYAPWPDEVVARIRDRTIAGVAGNYDSTVATGYDHCGCHYDDPRQKELGHESFTWTVENVSAGTKRFLASLPFRLDVRPRGGHAAGPTLVLVHGNPVLNTVYWSADRDDDFCRRMAARLEAKAGDVVAFGHTHVPWHRVVDGVHFVNAGSVGRPKDGDPRACWVRIDFSADEPAVDFERVHYDLSRARVAIRRSALPDAFADQLAAAGAPGPGGGGSADGRGSG